MTALDALRPFAILLQDSTPRATTRTIPYTIRSVFLHNPAAPQFRAKNHPASKTSTTSTAAPAVVRDEERGIHFQSVTTTSILLVSAPMIPFGQTLGLAADFLAPVVVECTLRLTIPCSVVDPMGPAPETRSCRQARGMIQPARRIRVVDQAAFLALDIEDQVVGHRIHSVGSGAGISYRG